jgi:hypothetical protein
VPVAVHQDDRDGAEALREGRLQVRAGAVQVERRLDVPSASSRSSTSTTSA